MTREQRIRRELRLSPLANDLLERVSAQRFTSANSYVDRLLRSHQVQIGQALGLLRDALPDETLQVAIRCFRGWSGDWTSRASSALRQLEHCRSTWGSAWTLDDEASEALIKAAGCAKIARCLIVVAEDHHRGNPDIWKAITTGGAA